MEGGWRIASRFANPEGLRRAKGSCVARIECPKGASASSPRLARQRLPWVHVRKWKQRQRRCGPQPNVAATPLRWVTNQTNRTTATRLWPTSHATDGTNGHNRVAVWDVCWTMTQRSALRATLGFGAESRWDSRRVEFESSHLRSN